VSLHRLLALPSLVVGNSPGFSAKRCRVNTTLPFSCWTFEKLMRKVSPTSSALPSLAVILTKYVTFDTRYLLRGYPTSGTEIF
jgi:hypothetical protein